MIMKNIKTVLLFSIISIALFLISSPVIAADQVILPQPSFNSNSEDPTDEGSYYSIAGGILKSREHPTWITKQSVDCRESPNDNSQILRKYMAGTKLEISTDSGFPVLFNPPDLPWLMVRDLDRPEDSACAINAQAKSIKPTIIDAE